MVINYWDLLLKIQNKHLVGNVGDGDRPFHMNPLKEDNIWTLNVDNMIFVDGNVIIIIIIIIHIFLELIPYPELTWIRHFYRLW